MTESERTSPSTGDAEITNLDGSLVKETHPNRRQVLRRGLKAALTVTTAAGVLGGEQAVSDLIEAKNQTEKRLREALLREQQAEAKTATRLNAYKEFMYGVTISDYIDVLGYPDGHSGALSRLTGFLAHPANTKAITDAMKNGKYEQRTHAFVRMKGLAKSFVETQYEAIQNSKAFDGSAGEAYTGNKESFIVLASDLIAYATSRGAQPQISENPLFPTEAFANDESLLYLDEMLAIASNTKTAEIFTPSGAKQEDPRQYFLIKLSEVSSRLQETKT